MDYGLAFDTSKSFLCRNRVALVMGKYIDNIASEQRSHICHQLTLLYNLLVLIIIQKAKIDGAWYLLQ